MIPAVICVAGPTGSGKSRLALELASRSDCEIINADSRQVYSDFPITTAQPDARERGVCPHHLYGYLPLQAKISAGQWLAKAARLCADIAARGSTPVLVGGTGFYFDALLKGIAAIPQVPVEITAEQARLMAEQGPEARYSELARLDPAYAAAIHPHDRQRSQRALEVYAATGRTFSWWHANAPRKPAARGRLFVLNTSLEQLKPGLAHRIEAMLAKGACQEVRAAWQKCPDAGAPGWSGIGCAELLALIQGRINLEECRDLWLANTRAYAKRQLTWFRGRKNAVWIGPDDIASLLAADAFN